MTVKMIFRSRLLKCYSIERVFRIISEELADEASIQNVYVTKVGFSLLNYFDLRKYVRLHSHGDIYHVTGDVHYAVFALPRRRCILTIHDCVFLQRRTGLRGWLIKKLYLDWPVAYTKHITTISIKTKEEIVKLTGCNPNKIIVIENPVSPDIYLSNKPFNTDKPVILFIGSTPNKNLNRVIEALMGLSCTLNIIGKVTSIQRERIAELGIEAVLESNISDKEVASRYDAADIILFPSLYEGFGLPVLEGFKAGKAVITSAISPMKEVADDAAWLIDPYSKDSIKAAIFNVINDDEQRKEKIRKGLKIADRYLASTVASQYHKLYTHIFEQNVRNKRNTIF